MKNQFEAYLPVAQGKVLERYKQLNQQAIEISKKGIRDRRKRPNRERHHQDERIGFRLKLTPNSSKN